MAKTLCLCVALLWGLTCCAAATSNKFLQHRQSPNDPNQWPAVVLPYHGTYLICLNIDSLTQVTVKLDGQTSLFTVYARGNNNAMAMVFSLIRGNRITVTSPSQVHNEADNVLTVALIDDSSAFLGYDSLEMSRTASFSFGSQITFDREWLSAAWASERNVNYFTIPTSNIYWVMAQTNPTAGRHDVAVRYTNGTRSRRLLILWSDIGKPSFEAGAFDLRRAGRLYLTPYERTVRLQRSTMLSVVELKVTAREAGIRRVAFTGEVQLQNSRLRCRRIRPPQVTNISVTRSIRKHRRITNVVVRNLHTTWVLKFTGVFAINYGRMVVGGEKEISIRATGEYLVSMRPDPTSNNGLLRFGLVKGSQELLWTVTAKYVPTGSMTAFAFQAGNRLRIAVLRSRNCDRIDVDSHVSIALYRQ